MVLIQCLNFYCATANSKSLLAYQLGMCFISKLSRNDLNEDETYWVYDSLEELAFYASLFLYVDGLSVSSVHDAMNRLNEIGFLDFGQIEPTAKEAEQVGRDKKRWIVILPTQECYDLFEHDTDIQEESRIANNGQCSDSQDPKAL